MAKTTKLAKRKETALPVVTNQVDEMFGGSAPQLPIDAPLPQIKIMRESPQYEMPAGDMVKSFEGHIIYFCNANQYYSKNTVFETAKNTEREEEQRTNATKDFKSGVRKNGRRKPGTRAPLK